MISNISSSIGKPTEELFFIKFFRQFMPVACVGDPSEVGLFVLLTAPLRPRSAKASPAYFRLPLVLVKLALRVRTKLK